MNTILFLCCYFSYELLFSLPNFFFFRSFKYEISTIFIIEFVFKFVFCLFLNLRENGHHTRHSRRKKNIIHVYDYSFIYYYVSLLILSCYLVCCLLVCFSFLIYSQLFFFLFRSFWILFKNALCFMFDDAFFFPFRFYTLTHTVC